MFHIVTQRTVPATVIFRVFNRFFVILDPADFANRTKRSGLLCMASVGLAPLDRLPEAPQVWKCGGPASYNPPGKRQMCSPEQLKLMVSAPFHTIHILYCVLSRFVNANVCSVLTHGNRFFNSPFKAYISTEKGGLSKVGEHGVIPLWHDDKLGADPCWILSSCFNSKQVRSQTFTSWV